MSDDNGSTPGVYAKLNKVMGQVGRIPKTGRNDFHGYDYATEADIVDEIRPLMAEVGLAFVPSQGAERKEVTVETKGGETTVVKILHTFRFVDTDDGSEVEVSVWGEGQDSMDKGSYKAFTGAEKYALMKTFMVATGDDPERDASRSASRPSNRETKAPDTPETLDVEAAPWFGKYAEDGDDGPRTWDWIVRKRPDYIKWLAENTDKLTSDHLDTLREHARTLQRERTPEQANGGAPSESSEAEGAPSDVPGEPAAKKDVMELVRSHYADDPTKNADGLLIQLGKTHPDLPGLDLTRWEGGHWSLVLEGLHRHGMEFIEAPDEVLSGEQEQVGA